MIPFLLKEPPDAEETYASHGTYYSLSEDADSDSRNLLEGLTINERFEEEPKAYFEEKVMTAVFR